MAALWSFLFELVWLSWAQHVREGWVEQDERLCPQWPSVSREVIAAREWKSRVGSFEHLSSCSQP